MTNRICLLIAVIMIGGLLYGCGQPKNIPFTADDEVFTYTKIDPEKTHLVVARSGNIDVNTFCRAFEKLNPDVQVIYIDITAGNRFCVPLKDWIAKGYAPDILFCTSGLIPDDFAKKYFVNLSGNPVINNYQAEALGRTDVDGEIYYLPGPSNVNAIMYNKTLFDKYNWRVPTTFDEFVALCIQIREDTNGEIVPWNPNAKYDNELSIALEAFTYEELFGGVDNRVWYNSFIKGDAKFSGHMEPFYDMAQKLIDNELLNEGFFSYSATTRGQEFLDGKIAMVNQNISDLDNDVFDFGYMAYPTTKGNLGYICDNYSCLVGVPKKEHTQKEQRAIDRFLDYFSTSEGQAVYIGNGVKFSNVKGATLNQHGDLAALGQLFDSGHVFEYLDFSSPIGERNIGLYNDVRRMLLDEKTASEIIAAADINPYSPLKDTRANAEKALATAPKDMTILETSFFIADAYRDITGADIALIANNEVFRGNAMRVFEGDIAPSFITVLKPRSFSNGSKLEKVSMTGRQIINALNAPPKYDNEISNAFYAYSGLKCEIAPWNDIGKKYVSVKLADDSAIEPDKVYTVGIWGDSVSREYIQETLNTYDGTWEELMTEYVGKLGVIKAPQDERIKLIWN